MISLDELIKFDTIYDNDYLYKFSGLSYTQAFCKHFDVEDSELLKLTDPIDIFEYIYNKHIDEETKF